MVNERVFNIFNLNYLQAGVGVDYSIVLHGVFHTQYIGSLAWGEQWSGTASVVCLCQIGQYQGDGCSLRSKYAAVIWEVFLTTGSESFDHSGKWWLMTAAGPTPSLNLDPSV